MMLFDVCNESDLLKKAESVGWWVFAVVADVNINVSADVLKKNSKTFVPKMLLFTLNRTGYIFDAILSTEHIVRNFSS